MIKPNVPTAAKLWTISALCFLLGACSPQSPKEHPADKFAELDAWLIAQHDSGNFNGTLIVLDSGHVQFQKALGFADRESKRALELETVFYLGSIAKQFTAMGVMLLEHEGKLAFSDPIRTFFPELPSLCETITVHHMLTHTSGLPDYYDLGAFKPGFANQDVLDLAVSLDSLEFEPGAQYSYSNTAYVLLSMLVERVSGNSFREFLQSHIFDPLGMTSSVVYDSTEPDLPLRALGYTETGAPDDYNAFTTGGGGIFSNIGDLAKWEKALHTDLLLPQAKIQAAYLPTDLNEGQTSYYGYGWMLDEEDPKAVWHSGSLAGFRTFMLREMDRGLAIIVLTNFTNNATEIAQNAYEIVN